MYKKDDYLIYRKDVCKVVEIKTNLINGKDYYVLVPVKDNSLKLDVPVDNKLGVIRNLISKEDIKKLIKKIPEIQTITCIDNYLENEYKQLLSQGTHEDLIKIIKTTYTRNKERLDNNKKVTSKDTYYFELAEEYLYTEFSIVLDKSYEETKQYIISEVNKIIENK